MIEIIKGIFLGGIVAPLLVIGAGLFFGFGFGLSFRITKRIIDKGRKV